MAGPKPRSWQEEECDDDNTRELKAENRKEVAKWPRARGFNNKEEVKDRNSGTRPIGIGGGLKIEKVFRKFLQPPPTLYAAAPTGSSPPGVVHSFDRFGLTWE